MNILGKKSFSQKDIEAIINAKLEESINIEFKAAGALEKTDSKRKELSKDVSAMANSDGGVIFYGISEDDHVASGTSFIDGREITKEWIEGVITSNIQPRIPDVRIIPIRFNKEISKSVYAVIITKSTAGPHMYSDKKFYKRHNFQALAMEEYEVRGHYIKAPNVRLELGDVTAGIEYLNSEEISFRFGIALANTGKDVAEKYKLAVWLKTKEDTNISFDRDLGYDYMRVTDRGVKLSTSRMTPIFPNEAIEILRFKMEIKIATLQQSFDNLNFEISIFSQSGVQAESINLKPTILTLINKKLEENSEVD